MHFQIYFALFEALLIEKELLITNGHLGVTGLDENIGGTSINTAGLQTVTVDVNRIYKAKYSIQLFVVLICICLKEAHEGSNSVLLLHSWAEEHSLSTRMFKYWILILKFQMDYLVFIRSMREGNFKLFEKNSDISGEMIFSFSISAITLDDY